MRRLPSHWDALIPIIKPNQANDYSQCAWALSRRIFSSLAALLAAILNSQRDRSAMSRYVSQQLNSITFLKEFDSIASFRAGSINR